MRMLVFLMVLLCCLAPAQPAQPQPPVVGLWLTQDRGGVIQVFPCGDGVCGRIVGFFIDRPNDPTPLDSRGVTQCNLPLITDARPVRPDLWRGHLIDPRNGNRYGVELRITPEGNLALRGFLAFPLLGSTQIWTRYNGTVPGNCRIMPGRAVNALGVRGRPG